MSQSVPIGSALAAVMAFATQGVLRNTQGLRLHADNIEAPALAQAVIAHHGTGTIPLENSQEISRRNFFRGALLPGGVLMACSDIFPVDRSPSTHELGAGVGGGVLEGTTTSSPGRASPHPAG